MGIPALLMPEKLRRVLWVPQGTLLTTRHRGIIRDYYSDITVGDVVSNTLKSRVRVWDARTLRVKDVCAPSRGIRVINPRGTISLNAYTIISMVSKGDIIVCGEEDLLTIPATQNRRAKTCIYGQPGVGIVVIRIDKFVRRRMREILKTFKPVMYPYNQGN